MRADVAQVRADSRANREEYGRITATFPVTQTTTENMRATVVEFTKIAQRSGSPEQTLRYVSQVLNDFPQIEINSLLWQLERPDAAKPAAAPAGAATPASPAQVEVLEISGRVPTMARSDYRAITAEVQRFAEALGGNPKYQVQRTALPFDVTSEGTLSGDIGAASEGGEAPRFTIYLARGLP
jgi:hypothetical protein